LDLNDTALVITATASVCLGIAVYQRTPDRVWNRIYALHATAVGLWTFTNFLIMTADNAAQAGLWLRISHLAAAIVICTCVDFAWAFPDRIDYADSWRRAVLYGTSLFFGTVGFAPALFRSIDVTPHVVSVVYGWPFAAFGVFTAVALAYADLVMVRKLQVLHGVPRVQVVYVLLGLIGSQAIALVTMVVIPLVWGTTACSGWGTAGYIVAVLGMGYAIAKHRLMPPELAVQRLAAYVLATGMVVGISVGVVRIIPSYVERLRIPVLAATTMTGLVMGLILVALYERVKGGLDNIFSARRQRVTAQDDTYGDILRTLDVAELLRLVARSLYDTLGPLHVVVYVRDPETGSYHPRAHEPEREPGSLPGAIPPHDLVVRAITGDGTILSRDHVMRFHSLHEAKPLIAEMDRLGAHVVAPMVWEDELIGLVVVGDKRLDGMYSSDEIAYLSQTIPQASLALRNAELYQQMAHLKDFSESILREMDNAVVVVDEEERIVVCNPAAERLFEVPVSDAIGQSLELLPSDLAGCIRSALGSDSLQPGQRFAIEASDGRRVPLACSASPLGEPGGQHEGAVAVISDLTLIQELEHERQEAERLSLIRLISAGMAHEIRNPLVAIRTFAELAPSRLEDAEFQSNFLTVARQEIDRIDSLVSDLLTLSKPADAVVETMNINEICADVMRSIAARAEAKDLRARVRTVPLDEDPLGDPARLQQALMNLVTNAVEAEPEGGEIALVTECGANDDGTPVMRVRVSNPGSYIPPEHIEKIFRPFYSRKREGTGLGLAISQTIVEEHEGKLTVTSTLEQGTEFVVELPLERAAALALSPGERLT